MQDFEYYSKFPDNVPHEMVLTQIVITQYFG